MHYMNVTCKLHAYYPVARDPARDSDSDWPEATRLHHHPNPLATHLPRRLAN